MSDGGTLTDPPQPDAGEEWLAALQADADDVDLRHLTPAEAVDATSVLDPAILATDPQLLADAQAIEREHDADTRADDPMVRNAVGLLAHYAAHAPGTERDQLTVRRAALVLTAFPERRGVPAIAALPYWREWPMDADTGLRPSCPEPLDPADGQPHRCGQCRSIYLAPSGWDAAGSEDGLCFRCATAAPPRKAIGPTPAGAHAAPVEPTALVPPAPGVNGKPGSRAKPGRGRAPRARQSRPPADG